MSVTPEERLLSNMARADGIHDFGDDGPKAQKVNVFNGSVPASSNEEWNEDKSLYEVFGKQNWRDITGRISQTLGSPIPGISAIQNIPIFGSTFSLNVTEANALVENLGFQKGAALVVDFNQHGFLSKLKLGAQNPTPVYYLLTPEVINDPAPKTSYSDTIFAEKTGLNVIPCIELRKTSITFPGGKPNADPHTKFFSNYTHALSPIRDLKQGSIPKKLVVDLSITTPEETKIIKDSKKQNSIKSLLSFLTKLFNKLKDFFSATPEIATKWTQKRGGDWFQAIAAMDIQGRTFLNALDNSIVTIDPTVPVFFVTHDRIALAYALFIGCNAIFLTTNEEVCYIFTRTGRPNLTQFYTDKLASFTDIAQKQSEINGEIAKIEELVNMRREKIGTTLQSLNTQTNFDEVKKSLSGEDGILVHMVEYTYLQSVLNRYSQIREGLAGTSVADKYMAYLNAKYIKSPDLVKFKTTDVYKAAKAWSWTYIPNRKRGITVSEIVTENAEKTDAYVFLPYIAELSDSDPLKNEFVDAFYKMALNLKNNSLPALQSIFDTLEGKKASISLATLAIQVYVYLRYNETSEEQRKNAQLLIDFSSYLPPADVEAAVLEGIGSDTLSSSQIYIPLLQAQNVAANAAINAAIRGGEKRKREEAETPTLNPYSPILVLMYALDTCVPELEQSPDVRVYARYIKFIENLLQDLNSNKKRYAVWEVLFSLNTTRQGRLAIAQALGLTPEQYRPYAMISHAFSDYLFGAFRGYDFRPAARLLQAEDIKVYLSTAAQNANASTYQDILQSYKNIRTTLGFVDRVPELEVKRVAPTGAENVPVFTKPAPVTSFLPSIFGTPTQVNTRPTGDFGGRKTYRRKPKHSKSSRHTKRAHRPDLAKGSETQSSQ